MLPHDKVQQEAPSLVEQTLTSCGYWDAVRYLLTIGRITQSDYEAWHLGEISSLEQAFSGSPKRIKMMLDAAMQHVEKRQLQRSPKAWAGWGDHAGQSLCLFEDEALHQHFAWSFTPANDRPQLDLFMDAPHIVCFNRIRTALVQQSPRLQSMFDDAFEDYANDPTLTRLETLFIAHQAFPDDCKARFIYFQQDIKPLAHEELTDNSHQATDFLAPLWRTLAKAMGGIPFDPATPNIHASSAWLEAKAYAQVIASVVNIELWHHTPALHHNIIHAQHAMQQPSALRAAWFSFCLHCPKQAQAAIEHQQYMQGLQASGLYTLWEKFNKLAHQPSIEDFPAWSILQQPEYLQSLPDIPMGNQAAYERFTWIKILLIASPVDASQIALRRQLQSSSSWLFSMLLKQRPGIF